ncbi:MAG: hypothetical protein ACRC75_08860, partial [Olsenella sp.]
MEYSRHTGALGTLARVLSALCLALAIGCALSLAVAPTSAEALTTDKATARPNENGGSGVIGAMNTRLTWEGTVEDGEEVSSITLS